MLVITNQPTTVGFYYAPADPFDCYQSSWYFLLVIYEMAACFRIDQQIRLSERHDCPTA